MNERTNDAKFEIIQHFIYLRVNYVGIEYSVFTYTFLPRDAAMLARSWES